VPVKATGLVVARPGTPDMTKPELSISNRVTNTQHLSISNRVGNTQVVGAAMSGFEAVGEGGVGGGPGRGGELGEWFVA
jgi:hypothetical protein